MGFVEDETSRFSDKNSIESVHLIYRDYAKTEDKIRSEETFQVDGKW